MTQRLPLGTMILIDSPASACHGRYGVILAYAWPDNPHSPVLIRLLPEEEPPCLQTQEGDARCP
jgi:hypothetical protein